MRTVVITEPGGPDVLRIRGVADPIPGPDDVLVEVKATALNRADTMQRQGGYPAPPGSPDDILGLEFSGVVLQTARRLRTCRRATGFSVCWAAAVTLRGW